MYIYIYVHTYIHVFRERRWSTTIHITYTYMIVGRKNNHLIIYKIILNNSDVITQEYTFNKYIC